MNSRKEELEKELARLNALKKELKKELKSIPLLEVGKWYKDESYRLVCVTKILDSRCNYVEAYGFDSEGVWSDSFDTVITANERLATSKEIEDALIKEAERRGYKAGDTVVTAGNGSKCEIRSLDCFYFPGNNWMSTEGATVFDSGRWASIIEQDKFAELKEAHRNGAVIQFYNNFLKTWIDVYQNKPTWDKQEQYRIKPDFEVGTMFKVTSHKVSPVYTITKIHDGIVSIGFGGYSDLVDYRIEDVISRFVRGEWIEYDNPKVVTNGRVFKRVSPNTTTLKSGWRYVDKEETIKLLFKD